VPQDFFILIGKKKIIFQELMLSLALFIIMDY